MKGKNLYHENPISYDDLNMKKFIFLNLIVLMAIGIVAFRQPLFVKLVEWRLNIFCEQAFNSQAAYEKTSITDDGRVKIANVTFFNHQEGSYQFKAERVEISYNVDLAHFKIIPNIRLFSPEIQITKKSSALPPLPFDIKKLIFTPQLTAKLSFNHGSCKLYEEATLREEITFSGYRLPSPRNETDLKISFSQDEGSLSFHHQEFEGDQHSSLTFYHTSGRPLFDTIAFFYPSIVKRGQWHKGTLDGILNLERPALSAPSLGGKLALSNLIVSSPQGSTEFEAPLVDFFFENHAHYQFPSSPPNSLIETFNALISTTDSYVIIPEDGYLNLPYNSIEAISGELEIVDGISHLKGHGIKALDQRYPLELEGTMNLIAFDRPFIQSQLTIKPPGNAPRKIAMIMDPQNYLDLSFSNLTQHELDFIISQYSSDFSILGGTFDGNISLGLSEEQISLVEIKNLSLKDASFQSETHRVQGFLSKAQGTANIDFSHPYPSTTLTTSLSLNEGSIKCYTPILPSLELERINSELVIDEGVIIKSALTAQCGNIKVNAEVDGSQQDQALACRLEGLGSDFASLFNDNIKTAINKGFPDDNIIVNTTLMPYQGGIEGEGQATISNNTEYSKLLFGFNTSALSLEKGYFSISQLPLQKFASPFIFKNDNFSISGQGQLQGKFTSKSLSFEYQVSDVTLTNSNLEINLPDVGVNNDNYGYHSYDFINHTYMGYLPIEKAWYLEKNSGIIFEDISAMVNFKEGSINIADITTSCEEVAFQGNIDIDHTLSDTTTIDFTIQEYSSKLPDLQNFCSHFIDLPTWDYPYQGLVNNGPHPSLITMKIHSGKLDLETALYGQILNGEGSYSPNNLSLYNGSVDLEYLYPSEKLTLKDGKGSLTVGPQGQQDSYEINIPSITFTPQTSDFDLSLTAFSIGEIARFKGQIQKESPIYHWTFDEQLTHFGDINPHIVNLKTSSLGEITALEAYPQVPLYSLIANLSRLLKAGLIDIPSDPLNIYQDLPLLGELKGSISFDPSPKAYNFAFDGDDLTVGDSLVNSLSWQGSKQGKLWTVNNYKCDGLEINSRLLQKENLWRLEELHGSFHHRVIFDLEGDYHPKEGFFQGHLNNFQMNLADHDKFPLISSVLKDWFPQGNLQAAGDMKIFLKVPERLWEIDSHIKIALDNPIINGIKFTNRYPSNNLQFTLNKFKYRIDTHSLAFEGLEFSIPYHHLKSLRSLLEKTFDNHSRHLFLEELPTLKKNSPLQGSFSLYAFPDDFSWDLSLKAGTYRFLNYDHDIKNSTLSYHLHQLYWASQYRYHQHTFWVHGSADFPDLKEGQLNLSDESPEELHVKGLQPLTCNWHRSESQGLQFDTIEGNFSGLKAYILPLRNYSSNQAYLFQGKVQMNFAELKWLFPEYLQQQLESLQVGDGYEMVGQCSLNKDDWHKIRFKGTLKGRHFGLLGYNFDNLYAQINWLPQHTYLKNIQVKDHAGTFHCPQISFKHSDYRGWYFFSPYLSIENLRPSILYESSSQGRGASRPLIIDELRLENLQGELFNKNSYQGHGYLKFNNSKKNSGMKSLLAIPADLIARIGLDPDMLTPVKGTILYQIRNGRVELTELKDIYSEGHISKFLLSKKPGDTSFMDFNGNLYIKIKMKQYNILFKLAELFTITIRGTLQDPSYTFQKQPVEYAHAEK
ncbi:MAG: hypothetical protein ACQEP8_01090 [Chlamydiota bacterium]